MTQDPEVSYYLKHFHFDEYLVLQKLAESANKNIEENGYGYFVCELKDTGETIGLVGLNYILLDAPHFPGIEFSHPLSQQVFYEIMKN